MRTSLLLPLVCLVSEAAPPPVPLDKAIQEILLAFDEGQLLDKLPTPAVRKMDRPARDWLLAALREERLTNPFPKGSRSHREAEALRAFLAAAPPEQHARFKKLPHALAGTQVALWRWGQGQARRGTLPRPLRHAWEDLLLREGGAATVRGWALRHAFCFALAEADETRLAVLKETCSEEVPELLQQFQRAFALLGGPPPRIYLWSLPELEALDIPLASLKPHIRVSPLEPGTPMPPEGCSWIIPTLDTNLPIELSTLEDKNLAEARRIAEQVRSLGRKAYLAPSREPFEAYALAYFPIDIHLDGNGMIRSIHMGDAALAKDYANPTP